MEYVKDLPPECVLRNHKIGEISFPDGSCDVTDPAYNKKSKWALYDVKIPSGIYNVFIDETNFPLLFEDEGNFEAGEDIRITSLTIIHKEYLTVFQEEAFEERVLSEYISVDSGLCGFYNHKPNFRRDKDWDNFWTKLKKNENDNTCDCGTGNGVTVSSGFGDGVYTVYEIKHNDNTIGLKLKFND